MKDYIQQIGALASGVAGCPYSKLLVYAEVEDGVMSADVLFQCADDVPVKFRFAPEELKQAIYEFWSEGGGNIVARSWATMQYLVWGGKLDVNFSYLEQLLPGEELHDRRPRVIARVFPGAKVDFSLPNS